MRTLDLAVRPATLDDAEAIERIRVETWRATYRGLLPDGLIDGLRVDAEQRRERLRRQPSDQFGLVAEEGGDVAGYAFGGPERFKDPEFHGEVYAIYVLPARQGRGLGRALIRESARELADRGMTSLLIWVLRENAIGRRFYERLGGRVVREKPLEEFPGAQDHVEVGYGWLDTSPLR
ncbi:MAG TPA: GNAT family N-acetyltransferase [Candidatus Limnocylindria bacterium]|jgi:ribosomal protein S18 acetylase RimI-like enzyme|nr:GNAT family N-acetyltransferase [Candidatus Limnocylindria bacterium]